MRLLENVMLVDDDAYTNLYNKIVLQEENVSKNILVFDNGPDALDYLKTGDAVDLLLLDINMPLMNGWQFLEHYEQLVEKRKVRAFVVMLTASANDDDRIKAERLASVRAFMNKPLDSETIKEIVGLFE